MANYCTAVARSYAERVYVLASTEQAILLVSGPEGGVYQVTAWEPASGDRAPKDLSGAECCAQHAGGCWTRIDQRERSVAGVPPQWNLVPPQWGLAWEQCEALVPELATVGMRSRGMITVIGDPHVRVRNARERVRRSAARKRAGKKQVEPADYLKDAGPLGLGASRES